MAKEEVADRHERRRHTRYAVNIQVEIRIEDEVLAGQMVDISIEGLRISLSKLIKPSTDMVITFSTKEEVRILAQAVWTLEESSAGLPSYFVGAKIFSIMVDAQDLPGMAERTAFLDRLLP
jgi:hypothetical protein